MKLTPSLKEFKKLSRSGFRVPVAAVLPLESDARSLFEAASFSSPCVLLESARLHPVTGRYSVIAGEPSGSLIARGSGGDPFSALEKKLASRRAVRIPGFPPFVGGAVGVIGFEASKLLEQLPSRAEDDLHLPDLAFLFFDEAIVLDHQEEKLWVIALRPTYDEAVAEIDRLLERLRRPAGRRGLPPASPAAGLTSTHTRESFEAMVRRAKEFIAAGDIYQANLSQRFSAPLREEPWSLYRRLTEINPSPFAAFADFGSFQIVSASPERLIRVRGDRAQTRPIAGTRPKGATAVETARLRRELLLNEKERAEHLMLVDLERNDLGRVCRYDTVRVDDLMGLEEYSHVVHIVSNVQGRLKTGTGFRELMAALFPGGTISGCPKIRCLEVIDELEPVRRHFYTGSLGYLSDTGEMDLNILIRTAVVKEGQVHVQAGAGIVADSDPGREYEETLHKAQALLEVMGVHPELVEA
ncbi:MAG: anthranilate synthase component I family protein [Candidatus Omnitrophota bacterium]|nr:anthranilate synthase component I family protein [Candidatus Omnitrophota bacterium]